MKIKNNVVAQKDKHTYYTVTNVFRVTVHDDVILLTRDGYEHSYLSTPKGTHIALHFPYVPNIFPMVIESTQNARLYGVNLKSPEGIKELLPFVWTATIRYDDFRITLIPTQLLWRPFNCGVSGQLADFTKECWKEARKVIGEQFQLVVRNRSTCGSFDVYEFVRALFPDASIVWEDK